jgi:hypothetical protein
LPRNGVQRFELNQYRAWALDAGRTSEPLREARSAARAAAADAIRIRCLKKICALSLL